MQSLERRLAAACLAAIGMSLLVACAPPPGRPDATPRVGPARVGYLTPGRSVTPSPTKDALLQGLRDLRYVEGQDISFEYRFVDDTGAPVSDLAEDLVRLNVDVIVAVGTDRAKAAKSATAAIPIVMLAVADPLQAGLVQSLDHPGGNVTGMSTISGVLSAKRLELLHDSLKEVILPITRVAALSTPTSHEPGTSAFLQWAGIQSAAAHLGLDVFLVEARPSGTPGANEASIQQAFASAAEAGSDGLLVVSDALFDTNRTFMAQQAAAHRLPVMHTRADYVDVGGLIAFGPDPADQARRAAVFVDKILRGANPAELPVEQPAVFDFAINRCVARSVGLTIPLSVIRQATRIVEQCAP